MKNNIEIPESAAHMYPSDLEKFKNSETFATAFSVAVGNPDERSVPLFTLSACVEYAHQMVSAEVASAMPAMRAYARDNPKHYYEAKEQDPNGVHAWLARNDA